MVIESEKPQRKKKKNGRKNKLKQIIDQHKIMINCKNVKQNIEQKTIEKK